MAIIIEKIENENNPRLLNQNKRTKQLSKHNINNQTE